MSLARDLYIDLLKKSVGNFIYNDDQDIMRGQYATDPKTGKYVTVRAVAADPRERFLGGMWPSRAHTMIGMPRLDNLQYCVEQALNDGVAGDLIETGVWRGGACIFMRGILKAYEISDRRVWVADSFEGLPAPDHLRYPKESAERYDRYGQLAISLDTVRGNFERYGLLDAQVEFLKGWFKDTLPGAPIGKLAVMRLDGDMYESTRDALVNLYPKLSPGGFVIIDDFDFIEVCNQAVHDFRDERGITDEIVKIEGGGAYWRRGA